MRIVVPTFRACKENLAFLLLCVLILVSEGRAQTVTWINTGSPQDVWSNGANWSSGAPGTSSIAVIPTGGPHNRRAFEGRR